MAHAAQGRPARGNHLLSMLSDDAYAALAPLLKPVKLDLKQVAHARGEPFTHIYFPTTCAISAIRPLQNGAAVEVGTVGNEGFSGVEILSHADAALNDYIAQIQGEALRMTVADFRQAVDKMPELHKVVFAYMQGFLSQVSQSVACNRLHTVEARFARWMLLTHDRVAGDEFQLTQEFIAEMLGVQRPTVSLVAGQFQQAGLIKYSRGHVRILNREGLEEASCECYFDVRNQFQRLLGIQYG